MFELDGDHHHRFESNSRVDRKREELSTAASHAESNAHTREEGRDSPGGMRYHTVERETTE